MVISPQLQKLLDAVPRARRIRVLNDNFRATFLGGRVMLTQGVNALPLDTKARILLAVQQFKDFDEGNDPHGEHDFGSLNVDGHELFFKIDVYDIDMRYAADDPADPVNSRRVMVIMFVSEY
jgi:hypothetical protein